MSRQKPWRAADNGALRGYRENNLATKSVKVKKNIFARSVTSVVKSHSSKLSSGGDEILSLRCSVGFFFTASSVVKQVLFLSQIAQTTAAVRGAVFATAAEMKYSL